LAVFGGPFPCFTFPSHPLLRSTAKRRPLVFPFCRFNNSFPSPSPPLPSPQGSCPFYLLFFFFFFFLVPPPPPHIMIPPHYITSFGLFYLELVPFLPCLVFAAPSDVVFLRFSPTVFGLGTNCTFLPSFPFLKPKTERRDLNFFPTVYRAFSGFYGLLVFFPLYSAPVCEGFLLPPIAWEQSGSQG